METTLLVGAVIILACIVSNKITNKIGMPVLIGFIGLGMLFGTDGIFKIQFENYSVAETICKIALIFIMFYGGFGTRWSEARKIATKSCLLSTVGVVITALLTAVFCYFVLKIPVWESFLIGSVISSTDAASVFSILRSKKLGLKENTASLLEMESGSNDPCAYMLTLIAISMINGSATAGEIVYLVFAQFAYGIAIGVIIALISKFLLQKFEITTEGFDSVFVLAIAVISFALPEAIGGNGYLSTYIFGIILGNSDIKNKKNLVHFFDGITGLMQLLIFFLLGLLSTPSLLPKVFVPALLISVFLLVIARPLTIFGVLAPFKCSIRQKLLVSWSGLRGAASIVFAIMAIVSVDKLENDIFHIIFCIVLISILLQGSLIPFMSEKLKMIDDDSNVLKTFNDYEEEFDVQFIELKIKDGSPWIDKQICELPIPTEFLIVLILRDNKKIIPNGQTKILENDILAISAPKYHCNEKSLFIEETIHHGNKCVGKKISDYSSNSAKLVILIKRESEERVVIPNGSTDILEDDVLVIYTEKQ